MADVSESLPILRVRMEGATTSFRYPYFVVGRQPTYPMPPPATVYGHICSAAGEVIDPRRVRFAYHFVHEGETGDMEHAHMVSAEGGTMVPTGRVGKVPKTTGGAINILSRQFLFRPRMTLYLDDTSLEAAFRTPRYPVVLGRSQDLMTYTDVRRIELTRADRAYYEHTLLPFSLETAMARGLTMTMPRHLQPAARSAPTFGQYIALSQRLSPDESRELAGPEGHWVDPDTDVIDGAYRGVVFAGFVDTEGEP